MNKKYRPVLLTLVLPFIFACNSTSNSIESKNDSSYNSSISSNISSSASSKASSSISSSINLNNLVLSNEMGLNVKFNTKGARIDNISLDGKNIAQEGFIAGRVANRIANANFTLNGATYNLNKNEGNNILHGGSRGFGEVNWQVEEYTSTSIKFFYKSSDGDMGFPGEMLVYTTYTLSSTGELSFEIEATSNKDTIFNPINHLYMNLNGNTNVANHSLYIDANKYLEVNNSKLPTGNLLDVSSKSSLDYRTKKTYVRGNDHCLCLNGSGYRKVAELTGDTTGYKMELYTDRVALQLYDNGQRICLEAQDYIDAIHHDNFPSIVLKANQKWYSKSAYCFSK